MKKIQRSIAAALCALAVGALALPAQAESGAAQPAQSGTAQPAQSDATAKNKRGEGFGVRLKNRDEAPGKGQGAGSDRGGFSLGGCLPGLSLRGSGGRAAQLTDAQKAAQQQAQTALREAYKAFLTELVGAGILQQAEVDAYDRVVAQREIATDIDMMQWTVEKSLALRDALAKSGAERQSAVAAFVAEGLLTQAQADALIASVTTSGGIDYTNWTIGQVNDLKAALAQTGEPRVTAISALVEKGLLTQIEADALLTERLGRMSVRAKDLTEAQQTAWKAAMETYQAAVKQAKDTLQKAGAADESAVAEERQDEVPEPGE
jgi:hypothetical protein